MADAETSRAPMKRPRGFATEPERERPDSPPPSYGVPRRGGRYVAWSHVIERLIGAEAYWLATVMRDGRPHVVPIWGAFVEDDLYLETGDPNTIKNRNLAHDGRVVVHLDDVNDVVIVRGTAHTIRPDAALGRALAAAMHAKYPGYARTPDSWDEGGMVRVDPAAVLAWTDMPSATRWRFDRR
jgi:hypothetical protein